VRERQQVANRRAASDTVEQDARERIELFVHGGRGKTADLDLLSHGRLQVSRPRQGLASPDRVVPHVRERSVV